MRSPTEFGRYLRYLREDVLGVSQGEVVRRILSKHPTATGMTQSAYARYELGHRIPGAKNLELLAEALQTTSEDLLGTGRAHQGDPPYKAWALFQKQCAGEIAIAEGVLGKSAADWVIDELRAFRLPKDREMTVEAYQGLLLWYVSVMQRTKPSA